jgi:hypothetical protein
MRKHFVLLFAVCFLPSQIETSNAGVLGFFGSFFCNIAESKSADIVNNYMEVASNKLVSTIERNCSNEGVSFGRCKNVVKFVAQNSALIALSSVFGGFTVFPAAFIRGSLIRACFYNVTPIINRGSVPFQLVCYFSSLMLSRYYAPVRLLRSQLEMTCGMLVSNSLISKIFA